MLLGTPTLSNELRRRTDASTSRQCFSTHCKLYENNGIGRFTLASLLLAAILKLLCVPRIHSATNMGLVLGLRISHEDQIR